MYVFYYPTSSSTIKYARDVHCIKEWRELTKFSSRRDISSEVSHLFHFIFHRDPRYSRRGITKNIKQHMAQSCPSTSYS